jgi:hypothetical protein
MRKKSYATHATIDAVYRGADVVLDIDILSIGNDGYGPGEFWGRPYNDVGRDVVDEWRITAVMDEDGNPLPKADNKALIGQMENDPKFMDSVDTILQERLVDLVDDGGLDDMDDNE